ncbi:MAG TPA: riboflavin synthase, partial [Acidimicrobiales bacterium]|nr:riboflavin synthase [Acidimicrobiales bacterium]
MFTGLIEEVGSLVERRGERYRINASKVLDDAEIGDSIAVNGSCLTVVARSQDWWETDVSAETEQRTTIGLLKPGDPVNLERAVRVNDRL